MSRGGFRWNEATKSYAFNIKPDFWPFTRRAPAPPKLSNRPAITRKSLKRPLKQRVSMPRVYGRRRSSSVRSYGRRRTRSVSGRKYKRRSVARRTRKVRSRNVKRRIVSVGRLWPPEQMRVTMEHDSLTGTWGYANDSTEMMLLTLLPTVSGAQKLFKANTAAGASADVGAGDPRNWSIFDLMYRSFRLVSVSYSLTFINNSDVPFMGFAYQNTLTNRGDPVLLMDGAVAKSNAAAPWDATEKIRDIVEAYRGCSKFFIPARTDARGSGTTTKNFAIHSWSFDKYGRKAINGKFNEDDVGPGTRRTHLVTSTSTQGGLEPQLHILVTTPDGGRGGALLGQCRIKRTVVVEFIDRKMKPQTEVV